MTNRVIQAVSDLDATIKAKGLSQSRLERLSKALDMSLAEYCRFQEIKSVASLEGDLTLDEAQYVYCCLGTTPETFNGQSVAVKSVLTQVFSELLAKHLAKTPVALSPEMIRAHGIETRMTR